MIKLSKNKTIHIDENVDVVLTDGARKPVKLTKEDYFKFKNEFELLEAIFETQDVVTAIQRVHNFDRFSISVEQPFKKALVSVSANGSKFIFDKKVFFTLMKQSAVIEKALEKIKKEN